MFHLVFIVARSLRDRSTRIFKVVLLGDGGVGKTALRERFLGRGFESSYMATVGADFATHEVEVGGERIKLQIWDLAGQARFKDVRSGFFSGALGCLMVYDVARRQSAENLKSWLEELQQNSKKTAVLSVVANKIDLRETDNTALSTELGLSIARKLQDYHSEGWEVPYYETSAKESINVPEAFLGLTTKILEFLPK